MASSTGDVHHHQQFSQTSTTVTRSSSSKQQSSSGQQQHQSLTSNNQIAVEENVSSLEPHQPLYPVSEWDTKLGRNNFVLTEANIAKRKKQLPIYFSITLYFSDWFVLTSFYLFGLTLVSSFFYLPFLDLGQFHFSSQHFQIFGGGKNIYGEYVVCLTCILPHVVIETLHYYIGLLFFSFSVFLLYCWCSILGLAWWFPLFFFCCCCLVWSYLLFGCAVLPSTFHPTSTTTFYFFAVFIDFS